MAYRKRPQRPFPRRRPVKPPGVAPKRREPVTDDAADDLRQELKRDDLRMKEDPKDTTKW